MCGEGGEWMVKGGGGMRGKGGRRAGYARPPLRDTAGQCAGGTHLAGMHSCYVNYCLHYGETCEDDTLFTNHLVRKWLRAGTL